MEASREAQRRVAVALLALLVVPSVALAGGPSPSRAADAVPVWTDEALARGVDFVRAGDGGSGKFLTVVGGGACFGDFDGDGFEDLFLVNQLFYERDLVARDDPHSRMFRNNADGTFTDVTVRAGVDVRGWQNGCGAADYDADGDLDLFVTAYGENSLLRNDGDFRFRNVTLEAGASAIGKCPDSYPCWGQAAVFGDPNADGCLDLYVTNYVEYDDDSAHQGHNGPEYYDGQTNLFYRNRCDGTFAEETALWNLSGRTGENHGKSFQAVWLDYDGDGDEDVYVANDMVVNDLLENRGAEGFVNVAEEALVANPLAGMGLDSQDLDYDGWPDLYFTHYAYQHNGLYLNNRNGTFADKSGTGNLSGETCCVGWGTTFLDWNADGLVDILAVNGHTRDFWEMYAQERHLYRRNPGAGLDFEDVNDSHGPGMAMKSVARGLAMADFDFNGVLDFLVLNTGNTRANLLVGEGVDNRWLQVQLRQPGPNERALGAAITVTPEGGLPVTRFVRGSSSHLSQNGGYEYFGLGDATGASVKVRWPDGATESWTVGADRVLRLVRGDPSPREEFFPPRTTPAFDAPGQGAGWFRGHVDVTLAAADRGVTQVSGVEDTQYRVDGGAWQPYAGAIRLTEGVHELEFRSTDRAGNVEPVRRETVRVDATPPSTTASVTGLVDGWATGGSRVSLDSEDAGSGVARVEYRWAGDAAWTRYDGAFAPVGEGERTLEYRAVDAAGNVEDLRSLALLVDAVAPDLAHALDGPSLVDGDVVYVTSETRIVAEAVDGGSGLASVERCIAGEPCAAYDGPFSLSGEDGPREVRLRATDAVGNVREVALALHLDNHRPPPILAFSPAPRAAHVDGERVDLSAAGTDVVVLAGRVAVSALAGPDVSGNAWTRVLVDGVVRAEVRGPAVLWAWDSAVETPGPHVLEFEAEDGLGNRERIALEFVSAPWGVVRGG